MVQIHSPLQSLMPRDITGRVQRSCTGFAGMRGMFPLQLVLLAY